MIFRKQNQSGSKHILVQSAFGESIPPASCKAGLSLNDGGLMLQRAKLIAGQLNAFAERFAPLGHQFVGITAKTLREPPGGLFIENGNGNFRRH
jgi:hypothetical protein